MISGRISNEDPVIEIGRKKGRTILFSVILTVMAVYGAFLWVNFFVQKEFPEGELDLLAAFGFPVFVVTGVFSAKKMFDKRPVVILSPKGLSNSSNFVTSDLIKWNEIEKFEFHKTRGAGLIYIFVKDPDFFMRHSSGIQFIFMKLGNWFSGTPFTISTDVLDCNVNELMEALNYKLEKFKHTV